MSNTDQSSAGFKWPPAPTQTSRAHDAPPRLGPAEHPPTSDRAGERPTWWERVESAWLDPVALPLRSRVRESAWHADGFAAFCDRCGASVGPHETDEFGCAACRNSRPPWRRIIRLGPYNEPLNEWIREVKFDRARVLGLELGRLLGARLLDARCLADHERARAIVVPVPASRIRVWERGIDHTLCIAQGVARELRLHVVRALRRTHGPSQLAVGVSERAANVAGRIWLARPRAVHGRVIIVVDDVVTTGATMRASCRALGAKREQARPQAIIAATLAVTPAHGSDAGPTPE